MEDLFEAFSKEYSKEMDKAIHEDDEQRSARNPVIFIFIGDKTIEASKEIRVHIDREWDNGETILFFNIFSKERINKVNEFNFNVPYDNGDLKELRRKIYEDFHSNQDMLIGLNREIVKIKNKVLEFGNEFSSFEKINLTVVTRVDDPLNILVPDITLLVKTKLAEHFLIVAADLYNLLVEKNEGEDPFYTGVLSVSFFKEMEYFQSTEFKYNKNIEVFDTNRRLSVISNKAIFDMVYLLSDTNRKGIVTQNSLRENYNIISYINLIKNRKINSESYYDIKNNFYDDVRFKRNIADENGELTLATAGLAVIKRPNNAVAMTVFSCVYEAIFTSMKKNCNISTKSILNRLGLAEENLESRIETLIPRDKSVMDMMALMTINSSIPKGRFGRITLREAEALLYGDLCKSFYEENFQKPCKESLKHIKFEKEVEENLNGMVRDSELGLYCAYLCTEEEEEIIKTLNEKIKDYEKCIVDIKLQVENLYESPLEQISFFRGLFNNNESTVEAKKQIFNKLYFRKLEILKLELKKDFAVNYILALRKMNPGFKLKIEKLKEVSRELDKYTLKLIKEQDNYIGQNIKEYYSQLVKSKIIKLQEIHGENFYFKENFIGNMEDIIKKGIEELIKKVENICNKYILTEKEFSMTFEDELNERTNISTVNYHNKIFTKDEIYKNLCNILENNAIPKAFIIDYNLKKYEEKYFFGNYSSDFIKYAYNFDKELRNYAIGYIHEKRATGIEKLSLLGGFKVKDLVYYKNTLKYYDACESGGYKLHAEDKVEIMDISKGRELDEKKY